jgi:hypothetical protein
MLVLQAFSDEALDSMKNAQAAYYKLFEEAPSADEEKTLCASLAEPAQRVARFDAEPVLERLASFGSTRSVLEEAVPPLYAMRDAAKRLQQAASACQAQESGPCAPCKEALSLFGAEVDQARTFFKEELAETDARLPRIKVR